MIIVGHSKRRIMSVFSSQRWECVYLQDNVFAEVAVREKTITSIEGDVGLVVEEAEGLNSAWTLRSLY
jgi:hypothetical protein